MRIGGPFLGREAARRGGWETIAKLAKVTRPTLWRWRDGERSPSDFTVLQDLAEGLEVDPASLFDLEGPTYLGFLDETLQGRSRLISGLLRKVSTLALGGGYRRWPPYDLRNLPWRRHPVKHEPSRRSNYYARFVLAPGQGRGIDLPQVWHFAFQDVGAITSAWHPIGFVQLFDRKLDLFHFVGMTDHATVKDAGRFGVELWFGLGAAEFVVSSLHPFEIISDNDGSRLGVSACVRFGHLGEPRLPG